MGVDTTQLRWAVPLSNNLGETARPLFGSPLEDATSNTIVRMTEGP